jgi:hypothetical protein
VFKLLHGFREDGPFLQDLALRFRIVPEPFLGNDPFDFLEALRFARDVKDDLAGLPDG